MVVDISGYLTSHIENPTISRHCGTFISHFKCYLENLILELFPDNFVLFCQFNQHISDMPKNTSQS